MQEANAVDPGHGSECSDKGECIHAIYSLAKLFIALAVSCNQCTDHDNDLAVMHGHMIAVYGVCLKCLAILKTSNIS